MRKPDPIDIIKLYMQGNPLEWNGFLTACYRKSDIERLCCTRAQLQRGMTIAAKKKLNNDKIDLFFIRLQNSIENTIRRIVREKNPNPNDNPLTINSMAKQHKTERDQEIERYLRKTGF